jgi:hypothetical protein
MRRNEDVLTMALVLATMPMTRASNLNLSIGPMKLIGLAIANARFVHLLVEVAATYSFV